MSRPSSVLFALLFVGSAFVGILVATSAPAAAVGPDPLAFGAPVRVDDTAGVGSFNVADKANPADPASELEPSIKVDRTHNVVYVSGIRYCSGSWQATVTTAGCGDLVWKSADGGLTWKHVDPPIGALDGDSDIAVEQTTGRVYEANLYLGGTDVWTSDDQGASWAKYDLSGIHQTSMDRQWLTAGSAPGVAYLSAQQATAVYLCGEARQFVIGTTNGGSLWGPLASQVEEQGAGHCIGGNLVIDPSDATGHTVYTVVDRLSFPDYLGDAVTTTNGPTLRDLANLTVYKGTLDASTGLIAFSRLPMIGTTAVPRPGCVPDSANYLDHNFPQVAVDNQGGVYAAWTGAVTCGGAQTIDVWFSAYDAATNSWSTPTLLTSPSLMPAGQFAGGVVNEGDNWFPWLVAGDSGRIAVAWYHCSANGYQGVGCGNAPGVFLDAAIVTGANTATPSVTEIQADPQPLHRGDLARDLGDFFEIDYDGQGALVIASSKDWNTASAAFPGGGAYTYFYQQTSGPSLLASTGTVKRLGGFALADPAASAGSTTTVNVVELDQNGNALPAAAQVPYSISLTAPAVGTFSPSTGTLAVAAGASGLYANAFHVSATGRFAASATSADLAFTVTPTTPAALRMAVSDRLDTWDQPEAEPSIKIDRTNDITYVTWVHGNYCRTANTTAGSVGVHETCGGGLVRNEIGGTGPGWAGYDYSTVPANTPNAPGHEVGKGWQMISPPFSADGYVLSDSDVGVDQATGRLYHETLGPLTNSEVWSSGDRGLTWTHYDPVSTNVAPDDRAWLAVGANGLAYQSVHVGALCGGNVNANGDNANVQTFTTIDKTTDGGLTWGAPTQVTGPTEPPTTNPHGDCEASAPVVDPSDPTGNTVEITVEKGIYPNLDTLWVMQSTDGGATFHKLGDSINGNGLAGPPGCGASTGTTSMDMIFPVTAVDAAGTVYAAWAELTTYSGCAGVHADVFYTYLTKGGATWAPPVRIEDQFANVDGGGTNVLPWIVAGDAGRLGIAWYHSDVRADPTGSAGAGNAYSVRGGVITGADSASPRFSVGTLTATSANPNGVVLNGPVCTGGSNCNSGRDLADFLMVDYDSQGALVVAYAESAGDTGTGPVDSTNVFARITKETRGPSLLSSEGEVRHLAGFRVADATFEVGTTHVVGVQELDQFGAVLPHAALVPYTVSAASAAGSLTNGVLTASTVAGTATNGLTVSATGYFENAATTQGVTVTLTPGPIDHVSVAPAATTVAAGGSATFVATAYDRYGNALSPQPSFTYSVTSNVGSIGATDGILSAATSLGGASSVAGTVTATALGKSGTSSVTLVPGALDHILVTPDAPTVVVGKTQAFTAKGYDAFDNLRSTGAITWSLAGGSGSIDSTGLFSAGIVPDSLTVTATSGAVSGSATVNVVHGAGATLDLDPASASVVAGTTQRFTATEKDAYGNPFAPGPLAWSATSGTVDGSGLYTAPTVVGADTVTAKADGLTGTATVNVLNGAADHVVVSPASASVAAGATRTFTAQVLDQYGNPVVGATVGWGSDVGSIDQAGVLTAPTSSGVSGSVSATYGGLVGSATVSIVPAALDHVVVSPASASVTAGATQAFTAAGFDAFGNAVAISPSWSASAGTIDASGLLTAPVSAGALTVTATAGGKSDSAAVSVVAGPLDHVRVSPHAASVAAGKTQAFTVAGFDQYENPVTVGSASWTSTLGSVSASGLFTAPTVVGSGSVTATVGSTSDTASVDVVPADLATISISPASVTLAAGATQTFTATGTDAYGNSLGTLSPGWTTNVGAVSPGGVFTADTTPSTGLVTATSQGKSASASVTIVAGPLAAIVVTPSDGRVAAAGTLQFSAAGRDAFGNAVAISPPTWSTDSGTIDASGLLTAPTTAGTGTVTATADGVSGAAQFTVVAAGIVSVTVSPDAPTLSAGDTRQFSATGTDVHGNTEAITDATWTTSAGTIDASGLLTTPTSVGSLVVTATDPASGVSGSATVTVVAGPVATVSVAPGSAAIAVQETQAFAASAVDRFGNAVDTTITWSTSGLSGTTIDSSGLATAGTLAGTATISATAGGVTGTATLVVDPGPAASVTISPARANIPAGVVRSFTARALDAFGNLVTSDPAEFAFSADRGVVDASGLYTAPTTVGADSVTATRGGLSATATLTIVPGPVVSVIVTPSLTVLNLQEKQTFTASGADAYGNPVTLAASSLTWSADSAAGSIVKNSDGSATFTATDAGNFTRGVSAKASGVTGHAETDITALYEVRVVMSDYQYRVSQLDGPHGVVIVLNHAGVPRANANAHVEIASGDLPLTFFYENGPTDANGIYQFSMMPANLAAPPGGYFVFALGSRDGNTGQDATSFAVSLNRNVV